jgi:hypothetical protein
MLRIRNIEVNSGGFSCYHWTAGSAILVVIYNLKQLQPLESVNNKTFNKMEIRSTYGGLCKTDSDWSERKENKLEGGKWKKEGERALVNSSLYLK